MTLLGALVLGLMSLVALILLVMALSALLSVLGGVQFVATPASLYPAITDLAQLKPGERFAELGSGRGELCLHVAKTTGAKALGIEINPLLVLSARWRARRQANVQFRVGTLYRVDLRQAQAVYCYLLPHIVGQLAPKFAAELPRGARVISYAFPLPGQTPVTTLPRTAHHGPVYVYQY